ncbi:hypothetical protein QL093DRAFT_2528917 [Fusarium oxysporum]|nr:hypothetical protein QL093DRAFT_2528917 [Fusarium oxysporum]
MTGYSYVSLMLSALAIPLTRTRQTKGHVGAVKFSNISNDEEGDNRISTLKHISSDYFCQVLNHRLFAKVNLNVAKGVGL